MFEQIPLDVDKRIYWMHKDFGLTFVYGDTGTGKSVLIKNILSSVWYNPESKQSRRIIIIDPKGDWVDRDSFYERGIRQASRQAILDGRHASAINCKIIRKWKPTIKDMTASMWEVFGFPEGALSKLNDLLKNYQKEHKNDPYEIHKMIEKAPSTQAEASKRGEKFYIPAQSKYALLIRFKPSMFTKTKDIHLPLELERSNIIFIPPTEWRDNTRLMRVYYGLLLKKITPTLQKLHPMLVFEEASRLFPAMDKLSNLEMANTPAIITWLDDMLNVLMRRFAFNVVVIAQRPSQLHHTLFEEPIDYTITFRQSGDSNLRELEYDFHTGTRQFYFIDHKRNMSGTGYPAPPKCEA